MILPLHVDPVLSEALTARVANQGSTATAWLTELLVRIGDSRWTVHELSTMGLDPAQLYREVSRLPIEFPARVTVDLARLEACVRQIDVAPGQITYCGLLIEGDDFFDGPLVVLHEPLGLPDTMVVGLAGTRLGDLVATGLPGLDDRIVSWARQTEDALPNAAMGWKGPPRRSLELHLTPAPPVAFDIEAEPPASWWEDQED